MAAGSAHDIAVERPCAVQLRAAWRREWRCRWRVVRKERVERWWVARVRVA
jgi:hypothetical protein